MSNHTFKTTLDEFHNLSIDLEIEFEHFRGEKASHDNPASPPEVEFVGVTVLKIQDVRCVLTDHPSNFITLIHNHINDNWDSLFQQQAFEEVEAFYDN